ncbi:MAG: SprT-like domain-containing protein [Planctomycetota bacterium]
MTAPLPPVADLERRAAALLTAWRVHDAVVEVLWNDRLSTSAGRAFVRNGRIELNPNLLADHPAHIETVLVHEAAHVAAFRLFGEAAEAHGRHWRALMRAAGHPPAITHDLPVPRRASSRRRHLYLRVCDACGDRTIQAAVRYGRCQGCSRRDSFLVLRAAATPAGRRALERVTAAEARRRCRARSAAGDGIMGGP